MPNPPNNSPPLPERKLAHSVGRKAENIAPEVRWVQRRLFELRFLARDAYDEPGGELPDATFGPKANVPEAKLPRTIAAIEQFERKVLGDTAPRGQLRGGARPHGQRELSRAVVGQLTGDEFLAVAEARAALRGVCFRGLRISAPVGNLAALPKPSKPKSGKAKGKPGTKQEQGEQEAPPVGNFLADVLAVRAFLERMPDSRGVPILKPLAEQLEPEPDGTIPVAKIQDLRQALVKFEDWVVFWKKKGKLKGTFTPGCIVPGDALHQLFDHMTVYVGPADGATPLRLVDHTKTSLNQANLVVSERGVSYSGSIGVSELLYEEGKKQGIPTVGVDALARTSEHEGKFDSLNTWDVGVVSIGLIQFALTGGLPNLLAHLKIQKPATWARLFRAYGLDFEFNGSEQLPSDPTFAVIDFSPDGEGRVLRDGAAREALRNDQQLAACIILACRDREVQLAQVAQAFERYYLKPKEYQITIRVPTITAVDSSGATPGRRWVGDAAVSFSTSDEYRSLKAKKQLLEQQIVISATIDKLMATPRAKATIVDRFVQEGEWPASTSVLRLSGAIHRVASREALTDLPSLQKRSDAVVQQMLDDVRADTEIAAAIGAVFKNLDTLRQRCAAFSSSAEQECKGFLKRRGPDIAAVRERLNALPGLKGEPRLTPEPPTLSVLCKELGELIARLGKADASADKHNLEAIAAIKAAVKALSALVEAANAYGAGALFVDQSMEPLGQILRDAQAASVALERKSIAPLKVKMIHTVYPKHRPSYEEKYNLEVSEFRKRIAELLRGVRQLIDRPPAGRVEVEQQINGLLAQANDARPDLALASTFVHRLSDIIKAVPASP